jgi:hypothetical protein
MDFQFYPTPPELATKAWAKFQNKNFVRILEPEAGSGDLIKAMPWFTKRNSREVPVDCCEIDFSKHANLREIPGVSIVGFDFMAFGGGSIYSHIIMNPPFAEGASHVLKAWEIIFDGEIVAIINAETLRNPYSRERMQLASLVERFGEVEYIESAFAGDDAERKTEVEIALVYLRKHANLGESIVGTLISDLQAENAKVKAERLAAGFEPMQELAIPSTVIENSVITFNASVTSMRAAVTATARANYYAGMLGETMAVLAGETVTTKLASSVAWVKSELARGYLVLKDKAWAGMLRSSQVTSKLSSSAQKRVESEFERIKELEFTVDNIFGFINGMVENQGQIQLDMACDVFDLITRFHTDNLCFYKGWKSNDNQRTCGMRIKTTRFVIPGNESYKGSRNLSFECMNKLADFDKVFAMLDGKSEPDVSLTQIFNTKLEDMCAGERVASSYFETRYYPGAGTIHFFATNKSLVDKLNKLVGEHRKWLPSADAPVAETFWQQYERAEKFDKELRAEIDLRQKNKRASSWDHPLRGLHHNDERLETNRAALDDALTTVLERNGISVDFQLKGPATPEQLLLLAA